MGFELSLMQNEVFKDNNSTFMQRSNNAFFNFKSEVINICFDNKALKLELERKDISFWYDPDKIESFFEQNNLKEKYDAIKTSKVFDDYMACVFFDRLTKYASDKNLNINDINKKQMSDNSFELLDFFMREPSFKYVLKSDYLYGLLFSDKTPNESDIEESINALINYTKIKKREREEDITREIINKLNEFYNFVLENVTPEKRQELEKQNQIIYGMLNKSLGKAEYKDKIFNLFMEEMLRMSQISFAATVISLFTSLSAAATLAIAVPWFMSLPVFLLFYYALGGKKSKEKKKFLEYFVGSVKKNIEGQDSKKLGESKKPRLTDSYNNKNKLILLD